LGLNLTFFGFSALRCAMAHYLQSLFDLKIITVNQYGKEREQVDPVINLREIFKKYGILTRTTRESPYSFFQILTRELT
jgi:hypothetical protein